MEERIMKIPLDKIVVPKGRIRRDLGDVEDLKRSIEAAGVIHPIIVRPIDGDMYELVVGERRLRAYQELGYREIPAVVRPYTPPMARLAEIEENLRRRDYDSVERAKALAEYYQIAKEILGETKPGRPKALTSEQVELARRMREQGKSLSEIAGEFGVGKETVRQYLKETETAVQASSADSEKIVQKLVHSVPISGRESASGEEPDSEILPERGASRAVAEEFAVSHSTIVRAVRAAEAISKYPALERLSKVSDVQRVVRLMENRLFRFTEPELEAAVDLSLKEKVDPVLALLMQRIPRDQWSRILKVCREGRFPRDWIIEAASLIVSNQDKDLTIDKTLKLVAFAHKEYRVKLWHYAVVEKIEEAAGKAGLTEEQYIAVAALEKLYREGLLDEMRFREAVKYVELSSGVLGFQSKQGKGGLWAHLPESRLSYKALRGES